MPAIITIKVDLGMNVSLTHHIMLNLYIYRYNWHIIQSNSLNVQKDEFILASMRIQYMDEWEDIFSCLAEFI